MHIQLALGDLGTHLSYEELINVVHLESCTVQTAIFPFEFRRSWIIFSVIFTSCRKPIDVEVLKFVNANYSVLIKSAEARRPPLEHIVSKDIELTVLGLVFEYMDAFREVCSENTAAFLNLNAHDGRDKVFVLLFTKKLLLAQIVDTDNVSNAGDQLSGTLVKGIRDVFTRCAMQEF